MKQTDYKEKYYEFVDMYSSEANKHLNTVVELNWANIQRDELQQQVAQLQQQVAQLQQQPPLPPKDPFGDKTEPQSDTHQVAGSMTEVIHMIEQPDTTPVGWKQLVLQHQHTVNQAGGVTVALMACVVGLLWLRRARVIKHLKQLNPQWNN